MIDEKGRFITTNWVRSRKLNILKDFTDAAEIPLLLLSSEIAQIRISQQNIETIVMKPVVLINIDKWFVYNGAPFVWEIRSTFITRDDTLFKYLGDKTIEVGILRQERNNLRSTLSLRKWTSL